MGYISVKVGDKVSDKVVYKVGDKYVCVLGWISVIWGCYGAICVIFIVLCKGNIWVKRGVIWGDRCGRDSVNVFYMGIYVGVWRGFDLKWGVVLLGWKGWLYWIGVEFRWVIRGSVRGNRGTVIGLGFDRGVWFYCVCWDEVDNALRKGRGLTKNVNRGYVYKYKKS